jgi:signal transduction histidine kinase
MRRGFKACTFPVAILLAWLSASGSAWAADPQARALVLYSTRRDAQIAVVGDREMPRIIEAGLERDLDYYSEYIDRGRFPDPQYQEALRDFLRSKYRGLRFDVVIAMQELALEVIGKYRNDLFPDTPVVFFATTSAPRRISNATGVVSELNFAQTLDLAAALQPDVRHVFVVSGADPGSVEYEQIARRQLARFEPRLTITYLAGLTTEALQARLASLPEQSLIYYLVANQDGAGHRLQPLDYLDSLAAVANAPMYCWVDSAIGHGIVGGSLKSQTAETDAVARLAVRVLRGESADAIAMSNASLNVAQVDWRELRRWGIAEARVPPGTRVLFQEPSAWERYKRYIVGSAALVFVQALFIVALLVQRARRRRAEARVRGRERELRASFERIRDLGGRLLNAQETERARIARELHDDISQQVILLSIDLELLVKGRADPGRLAGEALSRAQSLAKSVHDLSHRLHPARLRLVGLVAALEGLQHDLSTSGIPIAFAHDGVPSMLPPDVMVCVFRTVQEAVQNALKYSRAHQISIRLIGSTRRLALTVADDGVGFDVDAAWGRGLGLISMGERLETIDGTFAIRSTPGAGTTVEVVVPLHPTEDTVSV